MYSYDYVSYHKVVLPQYRHDQLWARKYHLYRHCHSQRSLYMKKISQCFSLALKNIHSKVFVVSQIQWYIEKETQLSNVYIKSIQMLMSHAFISYFQPESTFWTLITECNGWTELVFMLVFCQQKKFKYCNNYSFGSLVYKLTYYKRKCAVKLDGTWLVNNPIQCKQKSKHFAFSCRLSCWIY